MPLAEQDRSRWDTGLIAEGVTILQAALARDRLGEYQAQAAIAALHADARERRRDRLGADRGVVRRAAAPHRQPGGARSTARWRSARPTARRPAWRRWPTWTRDLPRYAAVTAYLHERAGDLERAAELYAEASRAATSVPERDHLTMQSARVRHHP